MVLAVRVEEKANVSMAGSRRGSNKVFGFGRDL
jgi:hypothetical protein